MNVSLAQRFTLQANKGLMTVIAISVPHREAGTHRK